MKEYENIISKSNLQIQPIEEENMDLYQYLSSDILKYFYIRNNIFLERLSNEQIKYLYHLYTNNSFVLNEESEKFIKDTFIKTILEKLNTQNYFTNYGPDNSKFYKQTNSLIIGVRYSMNKDIFFKQEQLIDNLIMILESDAKRAHKNSVPLSVLKYNNYCIKKITRKKIKKT